MTKHQTSPKSPSPFDVPVRLLRIADLERMLRVSRRTVYYWIANGKFPKADVELDTQLRAWRYETVAGWIDSRTMQST